MLLDAKCCAVPLAVPCLPAAVPEEHVVSWQSHAQNASCCCFVRPISASEGAILSPGRCYSVLCVFMAPVKQREKQIAELRAVRQVALLPAGGAASTPVILPCRDSSTVG